jgi:4-amino-4-deoxy-L-arabinose transferase-like glycosyltransferase
MPTNAQRQAKLWYQHIADGDITLDLRDALLYAVIIIGSLTRLTMPFMHNPLDHRWSDPGRWWGYVNNGVDTPPLALIDPVFYQAWLSFVAKFTLDIPVLVAIYTGLLSVITPWLWYRFLRELLPNKRSALLGWGILAWLPSWIGIYTYFMTETLLLPLLGLALWLSWRSYRKQDISSFVLAALIWTIAGLTRGIAAPMAAAVMIFIWWYQRDKITSAIMTSLLIAAILGFTSYRNFEKTGMFAPLGQSQLNEAYAKSGRMEIRINYTSANGVGFVYGFGSPSMNLEIFAPFSDWTPSRQGHFQTHIDLDRQAETWAKAISDAEITNPLPHWQLRLENLAQLMFGPSWPDTNPAYLFDQLSTWMRFIWAPLFLLVTGLLVRRILQGERKHAPPVLAALLLWLVVQGATLLVVNEGRYRKPIEGLIVAGLLLGMSQRRKLVKTIGYNHEHTKTLSQRP